MGGTAQRPDVSVIVCHHVGELIRRCLQSVAASQGVTWETIVVTSSTENYEGTYTIHSTAGPAAKRNIAAKVALGEYLVFLDDDVEIGKYCLYNLVRGMKDTPKAGMGFCKILNMERRDEFDDCGSWLTPSGFLYARASRDVLDRGQYDTRVRVLASKSATCVVRRHIFRQVGGFDNDYFILGEETDLSWRIWLQGWEAWYFPEAVSWHAFRTSLKPVTKHYTLERIHFHGCKNYLSMLYTNLRHPAGVLTLQVCAWTFAGLGFLLRGQVHRAYWILRGMLWCWRNRAALRAKRGHVQSTRQVTEAQLRPIRYSPGLGYYVRRMVTYVTQGIHG